MLNFPIILLASNSFSLTLVNPSTFTSFLLIVISNTFNNEGLAADFTDIQDAIDNAMKMIQLKLAQILHIPQN